MMTRLVLGVALGAGAGALLGSTRSCETGACPLTASPWRGAFFGSLLGLFAVMATVSPSYSASDEVAVSASSKVGSVTEKNFSEVTGDGVVLVDFWAPWCGPCRQQLPILEKAAAKVEGRAKVVKLNVDEGSKIAKQFSVRSIPTLILMKDGKPVQRFVGVQSEQRLVSAIDGAVSAKTDTEVE